MREMNSENILIITAARPGLWFREKFTPEAWKRMIMEYGPGEYGRVMEELRSLDDRLNEWANDLEDLVKQTKRFKKNKNIDAGRVVEIAQVLTNINFNLKNMIESGKPLEKAHEYFLNEFQEEVLEDSGKVATAGFLNDFWEALKKEWLSERLLTSEEKKKNKERKLAILGLVGTSETVLNSVKKHLSKMEGARAAGKVGDYIDALREISVLQQNFEGEFSSVYNTYLKPIADKVVEKHQMQDQEKSEGLQPGPSWAESDEVISLNPDDVDVMIEDEVEVPLMPGAREELSRSQPPPLPQEDFEKSPESLNREELEERKRRLLELSREQGVLEDVPSDMRLSASNLQRIVLRTRHEKFLNELIKAAKIYKEPYILGAMISKYAQEVGGIDFETKIKLLSIVKEILDE